MAYRAIKNEIPLGREYDLTLVGCRSADATDLVSFHEYLYQVRCEEAAM
jgi:hypothetical protein